MREEGERVAFWKAPRGSRGQGHPGNAYLTLLPGSGMNLCSQRWEKEEVRWETTEVEVLVRFLVVLKWCLFKFYLEHTGQPISNCKQENGTIRTAVLQGGRLQRLRDQCGTLTGSEWDRRWGTSDHSHTSRVADSLSLVWSPRICISQKSQCLWMLLLGDHTEKSCIRKMIVKMVLKKQVWVSSR